MFWPLCYLPSPSSTFFRSETMSTSTIVKKGLFVVSAAMMLVVLYLIFIWVPTERNLGVSQRIFYFHVPIAWVGFLAFFFVLMGSLGY